jgi:3-oxoacyl-[acyl-carrier-protein] synthase-1
MAISRTIVPSASTSQPVAVTAIGAATALGGAVQAAAAARANLSIPSLIPGCVAVDPETNEPLAVSGLCALSVTEGFEGLARLERLGEAALHDLLSSTPSLDPARTAFLVALPRALGDAPAPPVAAAEGSGASEDEEEQSGESPAGAARRLAEQLLGGASLTLPAGSIQCLLDERRGTAQGIQRAIGALEERQFDAVVLLALDSLADPPRAERLLEERRLKTADHPTGFVPGEAAVALLLERSESARSRRQAPLALVGTPVSGIEPDGPDPDSPPSGRILHEVLAAALAGSGAGGTGSVYLDLNGESRRAHEWGNALVHARRSSRLDLWVHEIPALAFGETGAASPLLAVVLAARTFARSRASGDRALVAVVGEDGHRAAFAVRRGAAASR